MDLEKRFLKKFLIEQKNSISFLTTQIISADNELFAVEKKLREISKDLIKWEEYFNKKLEDKGISLEPDEEEEKLLESYLKNRDNSRRE